MATYEIADIERYFGLEEGFFNSLTASDAWTFVIKLHSLLESTCALMLTIALRHDKLRGPITRMPMGSANSGKLGFINALSLLSRNEIDFLYYLGLLRNSFVHNVRKTNATLEDHLQSLPKKQRKELYRNLAKGYTTTIAGDTLTGEALAHKSLGQAIYISAIKCFVRLHAQISAEAASAEVARAVLRDALKDHVPFRLSPGNARKFFSELT